MAAQQHTIKRQSIDLKITESLAANEIQNSVSKIYRDKLVHVLNQYFDGLSNIDAVHRIDKLEIDLGRILADDLEPMLEEKLEVQLRLAKPKIVYLPKQKVEVDSIDRLSNSGSETDLIVNFLKTGTLPWWVTENKQEAFTTAIHSLLKQEPTSVMAFFTTLLSDPVALKRLIYTADDQLLGLILTHVSPRYSAEISLFKQNLQHIAQLRANKHFRLLWWTFMLTHAFGSTASKSEATRNVLNLYFHQFAIEESEMIMKPKEGIISMLTPFYQQKTVLVDALLGLAAATNSSYRAQMGHLRNIKNAFEDRGFINLKAQINTVIAIQNNWNKLRALCGIEQVDYHRYNEVLKDAAQEEKINPKNTFSGEVNVKEIHDKDNINHLKNNILSNIIDVQNIAIENTDDQTFNHGPNNAITKTKITQTPITENNTLDAEKHQLTEAVNDHAALDGTDDTLTLRSGRDYENFTKEEKGTLAAQNDTLEIEKHQLADSDKKQEVHAEQIRESASTHALGQQKIDESELLQPRKIEKETLELKNAHLAEMNKTQNAAGEHIDDQLSDKNYGIDEIDSLQIANAEKENFETNKPHFERYGEAKKTHNDLNDLNSGNSTADEKIDGHIPPTQRNNTSETDKSHLTEANNIKQTAGEREINLKFSNGANQHSFDNPVPLQRSAADSKAIAEGNGSLSKAPAKQTNFGMGSAHAVSSFTETDRLYIPNSGLILFWPFLDRFFSSIGLVDEHGFIDQGTANKACLLLQYMAEGSEWAPFEPNLPLNKLLCGLELYEPVDVTVELAEDELAAADHLVAALLGNAPLWKTLSADGLRSAYVQRDGILSSRDGRWLLQVQRQTYDILLDRLPWTINTIKLPWMKNLIFVEWQQS